MQPAWSAVPRKPAQGYQLLRDDDLPLLRALIPVVLAGTLATDKSVLHSLDHKLAALSPEMLKLTRQLFDVLSLPLTRGLLTGVWGRLGTGQPPTWKSQPSATLAGQLTEPAAHGPRFIAAAAAMAWYERPESLGPPAVTRAHRKSENNKY